MPMGEDVGTILESASTYKEGGVKGIKYADKYSNGGIKYPTNEQGLVIHSGDRYSFTGDQRKDDYLNKQLATGKFGYNPNTGGMVRLTPNNQIEVSAKDQTIIDRGQQLVKDQEKTIIDSAGHKITLDDKHGIDFNKKSSEHQMFDLGYTGLSVKPQYQRLADDYISGKNQTDLARDAYMRIGQHKGNEAFSLVAGSAIPIGNASKLAKYAPKVGKFLKNTLKFDPSSSFGAAYNLPKHMIQQRSFKGGVDAFRSGLKGKSKLGTAGNVLKETVGGVHTLAVPTYLKDVANVREDALQGGLSATELVKVANPYLSLAVNTTKATKDFQQGNYASGALRIGSTLVDKYLPKSFVSKVLDPEQTKSLTTVGTKTFDLFRKTPSNLKKTGIISTDKED